MNQLRVTKTISSGYRERNSNSVSRLKTIRFRIVGYARDWSAQRIRLKNGSRSLPKLASICCCCNAARSLKRWSALRKRSSGRKRRARPPELAKAVSELYPFAECGFATPQYGEAC